MNETSEAPFFWPSNVQRNLTVKRYSEILPWVTYGRPATHPPVEKKLCDLETEHLENILMTQRHIPQLYSMVILWLLKQRYTEEAERNHLKKIGALSMEEFYDALEQVEHVEKGSNPMTDMFSSNSASLLFGVPNSDYRQVLGRVMRAEKEEAEKKFPFATPCACKRATDKNRRNVCPYCDT